MTELQPFLGLLLLGLVFVDLGGTALAIAGLGGSPEEILGDKCDPDLS